MLKMAHKEELPQPPIKKNNNESSQQQHKLFSVHSTDRYMVK